MMNKFSALGLLQESTRPSVEIEEGQVPVFEKDSYQIL